ncbi:SDR family NAD(P)-dependent oxidoreductase [Algoriphagus confluentis]|uniref:SDR family oxidoreductase n=1 Tax=Algoriphagus confluentis TaxID=1697556 RepID=A0ABQ6PJS2_9BACT|nr:SDR family oxidoreductase [Algoriphagus confluentis]
MDFWENKRVWIIGASSGIGEGLVRCLIKKNAWVVVSARRKDRLEQLRNESPSAQLTLLPMDVEDHGSIGEKTKDAWSHFGGLDVVFLNAGIAVRDRSIETSLDLEKKLFDINFWGLVAVAKALLSLKSPDSLLHLAVTSSLSGKYGVPKLAAYAASKHALHGYFDSLRAETSSNLRIHLVIPGFVRTDIAVTGWKGDGTANGKMQNAL